MITHSWEFGINKCNKHPFVSLSYRIDDDCLPNAYCEVCENSYKKFVFIEKQIPIKKCEELENLIQKLTAALGIPSKFLNDNY